MSTAVFVKGFLCGLGFCSVFVGLIVCLIKGPTGLISMATGGFALLVSHILPETGERE